MGQIRRGNIIMTTEKLELIIQKRDKTHYHAYIKGKSTLSADGNSSSSALGNLLLEYPNEFGVSKITSVEDKIEEQKKPPRGKGLFGGFVSNTGIGSSLPKGI